METKFTPGPWGCIDHGVGELVVYEVDGENALCIFDGYEGLIAWKDGYSISDEAEANANLISAAPDLYHALVELVDLESRHRVMPIGPEWDLARAALAKARGEK